MQSQGNFVVRPPFDADPSADIVFRSSDGVDFLVSSTILRYSSDFFNGLFTLPQPSPVAVFPVLVLEDATAVLLDTLLRILYPITPPDIEDLDIAAGLAMLGTKYCLDRVTTYTKDILTKACARGRPSILKVYRIACKNQLEEVARVAAYASLSHRFYDAFVPEIQNLTGVELFCLYDYHRRAVDAVHSVFRDENPSKAFALHIATSIIDRTGSCPRRTRGQIVVQVYTGDGPMDVVDQVFFMGWWISFRNKIFAEAFKGPISKGLVTWERIWTGAAECCHFCRQKVENDLSYGLLGYLKREIREKVMNVEFVVPWE